MKVARVQLVLFILSIGLVGFGILNSMPSTRSAIEPYLDSLKVNSRGLLGNIPEYSKGLLGRISASGFGLKNASANQASILGSWVNGNEGGQMPRPVEAKATGEVSEASVESTGQSPAPQAGEENPRVVERIIERKFSGVSEEDFNRRLSQLDESISSKISRLSNEFMELSLNPNQINSRFSELEGSLNTLQNQVSNIDSSVSNSNQSSQQNFSGINITGATISDSTITSSSVSGTSGVFNSLTSNSGNFSSSLIVSGNVGVRTSTPSVSLHISGTDGIVIPVGTTADRPSGVTGLLRYNSSTAEFEGYNGSGWIGLGKISDSDGDTYVSSESFPGSGGNNLYFYTYGQERLKIDSSGNVGIGSSTPIAKLAVSGDVYAESFYAGSTTATTTFAGNLLVGNNPQAPALFVDSASGNTGLGTTTPWKKLSVNGGAAFTGLSNDGTGYYLCLNATTGEMATSTTACGASSERFKENIEDLNYGLEAVLELRPVSFDWKKDFLPNGTPQIGFIAEEVDLVIPEVVGRDSEGKIMNVDYPKFTAILVRAIQDLDSKFNNMRNGFLNGITKFKEIVTDRITAKQVCLEDVCIDKNQLQSLLNKNGGDYTVVSEGPLQEETPSSIYIDLIGETFVSIEVGEEYLDEGAEAFDIDNNEIPYTILINDEEVEEVNIDISKSGLYTIRYVASLESGGEAYVERFLEVYSSEEVSDEPTPEETSQEPESSSEVVEEKVEDPVLEPEDSSSEPVVEEAVEEPVEEQSPEATDATTTPAE